MKKRCWTLFTTMFFLSAFTFGGGFVIIPLMRQKFAAKLGWLTEDEILDMAAFARSSPGAVTVNVAVQVGARMAGMAGAVCGVLGTIIPPLAILCGVFLLYDGFSSNPIVAALLYGMRIAVSVAAADAISEMAAEILRKGDRGRRAVMAVVCLLSLTTEVSALWLLAGSAGLGILRAGRDAA